MLGLEAKVLVLAADFFGLERGRRLRNLREVIAGLAVLQVDDICEHEGRADGASNHDLRSGSQEEGAAGVTSGVQRR